MSTKKNKTKRTNSNPVGRRRRRRRCDVTTLEDNDDVDVLQTDVTVVQKRDVRQRFFLLLLLLLLFFIRRFLFVLFFLTFGRGNVRFQKKFEFFFLCSTWIVPNSKWTSIIDGNNRDEITVTTFQKKNKRKSDHFRSTTPGSIRFLFLFFFCWFIFGNWQKRFGRSNGRELQSIRKKKNPKQKQTKDERSSHFSFSEDTKNDFLFFI